MTDARTANFSASNDLSTWSQSISVSGSIVLSNSNKTATLIAAGTGGRTYLYVDIAVADTDWVYVSCIADSVDAAFDTDSNGDAQIVTVETGVQDGDQSYKLTAADNGQRRGILFQPYAGATAVRLRIGPGAATTGENGTLVISDVTVQRFTAEPTYVDKYYDFTAFETTPTFPHTVNTATEARSVYSSGQITEAAPVVIQVHSTARTLITGDSYSSPGRFPDKVGAVMDAIDPGKTHLIDVCHMSGEQLATIVAAIPEMLTGETAGVPSELFTKYDAFVIGTIGGNSMLNGVPATEIMADVDTAINLAKGAGITNISFVGTPPFKGYVSWSQARQDIADELHAIHGVFYKNHHVVPTWKILESPNQPEYLADDDYGDPINYADNVGQDADGLHTNYTPTLSGHQLIADRLAWNIINPVDLSQYIGMRRPMRG